MNALALNCALEKQRRHKNAEFQQKSEKEQKRQWEQRVQECEDNYWRSRLGKPLAYVDVEV